jgi:hypothetical protein
MGIGSAIRAGEAFFEIMAKDKTAAGIDAAEARLRRFGITIGLIGASWAAFATAGLAAIGVLLKKFAGAGDEISDAMNVTGLSSDFLQTLQFGAADAGVSFNALVGAMSKANATISKLAAKGGSIIGLDAKSLLAMDPDKRVLALVDAIEKIPNPAQRAAAAISVFGKSGAKLLPAFEGGAQALVDAMNAMKASGEIMSDEDRQLAVETEGAFLSLGLMMTRISQLIAAAVAPSFLVLASATKSVLQATIKFLDKNRALVSFVAISIGVIGLLGATMMLAGVATIAWSYAAAGLTAVLGGLSAVMAFLSGPVFLIGAALTACGVAAGIAAFQLDKVFNSGKGFSALKSITMDFAAGMEAIWESIVNGKWEMAGEIMAAGLSSGFKSGLLTMRESTGDFINWAAKAMAGITAMPSIALADLLGDAQASSDLRAQLDEQRSIIDQDKGNRFDKEREEANAAAARYRALLDQAKALKPTPADAFDFGNIARSASDGITSVQTLGVQSAAAAARLNNSAPGNQAVEKLQELVDIGQAQAGTLEEVLEAFEQLEVLTVE